MDIRHDGRFLDVASGLAPKRREAWRDLVAALHEASEGPLADWVFHGTTKAEYDSMLRTGFRTTDVTLDGGDGHRGTYWAKPLVAAFYAEDRADSIGKPGADLVILGIRLSDLEGEGDLVQDEMSVMCPVTKRLGRTEAEVDAAYEAGLAEGLPGWEVSMRATDSLACLASEGPEMGLIVPFSRAEHVENFVQSLESSVPAPGR